MLGCIRKGCKEDAWADAAGRPLDFQQVNLYHLVELLIKPVPRTETWILAIRSSLRDRNAAQTEGFRWTFGCLEP